MKSAELRRAAAKRLKELRKLETELHQPKHPTSGDISLDGERLRVRRDIQAIERRFPGLALKRKMKVVGVFKQRTANVFDTQSGVFIRFVRGG